MKKIKQSLKQQIVDRLEGQEIIIKNITLGKDYESIVVDFVFNNKKGNFIYSFFGYDSGIDDYRYDGNDDDDIYGKIQKWIEEHTESESSIKVDGKILK